LPTPLHLRLRTEDPDNILSPLARLVHDQCERRNLDVRRRRKYTAVVLHFGYWLADRSVDMDNFTTNHVESFLADHATGCSCSCIWKTRTEVEAMRRALNLAVKMRALRLILPINRTAIDREVHAFDTMLENVWGLSAGTRRKHRDMVRRLLVGCVRDGLVDMADLTPLHIRQFVINERGVKPATIRSYAVSLRCYLRYRTLLGDDVRRLQKAIPAPAMKTPAKLQTGFSPAELERLLEVSAEIGVFMSELSGEGLNYSNAWHAWFRITQRLGIQPRGGHPFVRIHDLRHSFICRRLILWQQSGTEIDAAMMMLSTYVGHANLLDTYWYIESVPELMAIAGSRFEGAAPAGGDFDD
jgi:site-specific recombinase XerD